MGEQALPLLRTRNYYDGTRSCCDDYCDVMCNGCLCVLGLLIVVAVVAIAFLTCASKSPSFKVESVSVLFDESNNSSDDATIRAEWNLRLSVDAGKYDVDFDYNDLHVLFRRMPSDWSRTVLVKSSDDPKNMTSLNATVETLLPHSFDRKPLEIEVMFVVQFVDDPIMKAACNHMMIGISRDSKEGIMEGGPRRCPYIRKIVRWNEARTSTDCFPIV